MCWLEWWPGAWESCPGEAMVTFERVPVGGKLHGEKGGGTRNRVRDGLMSTEVDAQEERGISNRAPLRTMVERASHK